MYEEEKESLVAVKLSPYKNTFRDARMLQQKISCTSKYVWIKSIWTFVKFGELLEICYQVTSKQG